MLHAKVIKCIGTKRFEVELFQLESGFYCIKHDNKKEGKVAFSETINDFKTASFMFDLKVQELEGN